MAGKIGAPIAVPSPSNPSSALVNSAPLLSERKEPPNLLVCQSWWKNCLVQGDQYKKYKQLYSKTTKLTTLRSKEKKPSASSAAESTTTNTTNNVSNDGNTAINRTNGATTVASSHHHQPNVGGSVNLDNILPVNYSLELMENYKKLPVRSSEYKNSTSGGGGNLGRRNERLQQRQSTNFAPKPDLLRAGPQHTPGCSSG